MVMGVERCSLWLLCRSVLWLKQLQNWASESRSSHDFAGSPAPPDLCCAWALSALTKAVDAQTSSLAAPPSLDFLPLVTSICSLCWCQQQQGALGQRMPHWKAVVVGFMLFNPFQSWSHLLFNAAAVSHGAKCVVMLNVIRVKQKS